MPVSVGVMEAEVAQRPAALFMGAARDAHQAHTITEVMEQGALDAAAQVGRRVAAGLTASGGVEQGFSSDLGQVVALDQW